MNAIDTRLTDIWSDVHVGADGLSADVDGSPIDAQTVRDVEISLGVAIYDRFHARRSEIIDAFGFAHIRDVDFESALHDVVKDVTTEAEVVPTGDHEGIVEGVLVDFAASPTPAFEGESAATTITLPAVRPHLTPGFFLVRSTSRAEPIGGPIVRLYVRIESADDALATWQTVISTLQPLSTAWQAKILSHPSNYPRADALVVYLPQPSWGAASALAREIPAARTSTGPVSMFANGLADGVTMAFEPDDRRPGNEALSFGQHRSRAVAQALMRARGLGLEAYTAEVERSLIDARIDPFDVSRNLSSPSSWALGVHG